MQGNTVMLSAAKSTPCGLAKADAATTSALRYGLTSKPRSLPLGPSRLRFPSLLGFVLIALAPTAVLGAHRVAPLLQPGPPPVPRGPAPGTPPRPSGLPPRGPDPRPGLWRAARSRPLVHCRRHDPRSRIRRT